ncbi:MAG: peptidylprolyl isomerase [Agarilytica sp.]
MSACTPKDHLAKVGGKTITQQEFVDYLKVERISVKDEQHRETILNRFLEREALAQAVVGSGALEEGLLEAKVAEYRKEILISTYIDKYLAKAVNDDALREYYSAHEKEFEDQSIHAAHILMRTNEGMSNVQLKAKLTVAQEAYSRLKAGENFSEIAKEYSDDTISGSKGGDLGWLQKGAVDTSFSDRVFAMKEGDISEPFRTKFGIHVVKILGGPAITKKPFESAKGNIRYQLRKEIRESEIKKLLSKVTINTK